MHVKDLYILEAKLAEEHMHEVQEDIAEDKDCPCPAGTHEGMSHDEYMSKKKNESKKISLKGVTKEQLTETIKSIIRKKLKERS